tara:strand:- start:87744 stop:88388 length:645 start_codon:yes stop_codon:yes gene_type:complete
MSDDSTPCFAHLLIDGQLVDPDTHRDVARFRRAERARLMALRRALSPGELAAQSSKVAAALGTLITPQPNLTIAAYWPIRGELDLRGWMKMAHDQGALLALPVVVKKDAPVEFHRWHPGCAMTRGIWDIPVPQAAKPVTPDIVICPLLGIDSTGYRLGNGGGYYDRTLAAQTRMPRVVSIGHDFCPIDTIFPMPWDVPMQVSVLGNGTITHHDS